MGCRHNHYLKRIEMINQEFIEDFAVIMEVEPNEIQGNLALTNDNWNSLAIISTIVLIDEYLGITIDGDKLKACSSVGELWSLIQKVKESPE
jgi:acyl carrier protein